MTVLKNNVQLIGNLGAAPQVKVFDNGKKMARFNMAISEQYRNREGETQIQTCWHTIVAWDLNADLAEKYLVKGKEVMVNGKLVNRIYTDKHGVKRYITEIQVSDLFVTSRNAA
jgi:single-strand DNA-binding protein